MPWFKVDDGMHKARKRIKLGRSVEGYAALGLWTDLGSWCSDQLTEGFITDEELEFMAPGIGHELAKRLEVAGLFERVTRYGNAGWLFHDWDDYNPTRDEVLAERTANAERQKRFRERAKAAKERARSEAETAEDNRGSNGDRNGVTNASVAPSVTVPPTRPDPYQKENQQPSVVGARKSATRGTRLPDDFSVTPEMVVWAREKCPDIDGRLVTEMFETYWRGESGAKAVKRNWEQAWRTWMLREQKNAPRNRPNLRSVPTGGGFDPKAAMERAIAQEAGL